MKPARLISVIVAVLVGVLAVISLSWPAHRPPVLKLETLEPAGITDDSGSEMWLATLSLSNSYSGAHPEERDLFFKDSRTEARVTNRWVTVEGMLGTLGHSRLAAGQKCRRMLLLPAGTDSCRITLRYAGARLLKGHLSRLAGHLPLFVWRRIPYTFWKWAGLPQYGPGTVWRAFEAEIPIRRPFGPSM